MAMRADQRKKGGKSKSGKNPIPSRFDGKCNYCSKRSHKEDQCWIKHPELKPEKARKEEQTERVKYALMAMTTSAASLKRQMGPQVWFTDSGASDHFSPHRSLFQTFHKLDEPTVIETAEGMAIGTGTGTITLIVLGKDDLETELPLKNGCGRVPTAHSFDD